jgi:hypothetical protein
MRNLLTLLSIVVLAACGGGGAQIETDLAGLRDMGDSLQVQLNIRDTAKIAAIYAPSGSIMPPNVETVTGREALEAFWVEFLSTGNIVSINANQVRANEPTRSPHRTTSSSTRANTSKCGITWMTAGA